MVEENIEKRLAEYEVRIADLEFHIKALAEHVKYLKAQRDEIASLAVRTKSAIKEFKGLKKDINAIKTEVKRQRNIPLKGPW